MPIGKKQAGYCYLNECIYQFGGKLENEEKTNICERYVINTNQWESLPTMNIKRSSMGVCKFNYDEIYIFYGAGEDSVSQLIEKYNIHTKKFYLINLKNEVNGF